MYWIHRKYPRNGLLPANTKAEGWERAIRGTTAPSQQRIRDILEILARAPITPSIRELGQMVGLYSTSTVWGYLTSLQHHGLIQKEPGHPRHIHLTDAGWKFLEEQGSKLKKCPCCGGKGFIDTESHDNFSP
jgi:predicted methyltransferase